MPEEKKTDVNIATEMMGDAFEDRFDTAFLVSGDSDLVPPIEWIRKKMPSKTIIVAFPPKRRSRHLERCASSSFAISQQTLRTSLLPDPVIKDDGTTLPKPAQWT